MPETEEMPSWWDILQKAQDQRKEIQDFLSGPTLSEEELDDLSAALAYIAETIEIAKRQLGLTSQ